MSKIGNFVMELQEQGALLPESHEDCRQPDFKDYADECMADPEFQKEMDKLTLAIIKDIGGA
jgi:hypothetical protein